MAFGCGLNLSLWDLFTIGDTGSRMPVTLGIDKTFNLTNLEDFHKAQADIQMKPGDGILETLHRITESYKNGD